MSGKVTFYLPGLTNTPAFPPQCAHVKWGGGGRCHDMQLLS